MSVVLWLRAIKPQIWNSWLMSSILATEGGPGTASCSLCPLVCQCPALRSFTMPLWSFPCPWLQQVKVSFPSLWMSRVLGPRVAQLLTILSHDGSVLCPLSHNGISLQHWPIFQKKNHHLTKTCAWIWSWACHLVVSIGLPAFCLGHLLEPDLSARELCSWGLFSSSPCIMHLLLCPRSFLVSFHSLPGLPKLLL